MWNWNKRFKSALRSVKTLVKNRHFEKEERRSPRKNATRGRLKNFQHHFSIKLLSKTIKVSEITFLCHRIVPLKLWMCSLIWFFRSKILYEKYEIAVVGDGEEKMFYCNLEVVEKWYWKRKFIMHNGDNFLCICMLALPQTFFSASIFNLKF